jgi:hypothetical protein
MKQEKSISVRGKKSVKKVPAKRKRRLSERSTNVHQSTAEVMSPSAEIRQHMIAESAYFRAEHEGFPGDNGLDDWLAAEKEIDARFKCH